MDSACLINAAISDHVPMIFIMSYLGLSQTMTLAVRVMEMWGKRKP